MADSTFDVFFRSQRYQCFSAQDRKVLYGAMDRKYKQKGTVV